MVFDPSVLDHMSREELIAQARVLGAQRAELLTRVELRDEIVRRSATDVVERQRLRGFLGVARDLVANVVEAGLNLPEAAARIRGETVREEWRGPAPVATVTLAEIYIAQGHLDRARVLLDQILEKEPDHEVARELKARLVSEESPKRRRPEPEIEPAAESVPPAAETESEPAPAHAHAEPAPEAVPAAEPAAVAVAAGSPLHPTLVLLTAADGTPYLYWELPQSLLARARVVVRVATFRAGSGAVERAVRDLPVSTLRGGERLAALDPRTIVRAALGFVGVDRGDAFTPLAVASLARVAGAATVPEFRPRWAPERSYEASERRALEHLGGR